MTTPLTLAIKRKAADETRHAAGWAAYGTNNQAIFLQWLAEPQPSDEEVELLVDRLHHIPKAVAQQWCGQEKPRVLTVLFRKVERLALSSKSTPLTYILNHVLNKEGVVTHYPTIKTYFDELTQRIDSRIESEEQLLETAPENPQLKDVCSKCINHFQNRKTEICQIMRSYAELKIKAQIQRAKSRP